MTPLKVFVIMGSVRRGRYNEKPAQWMFGLLKARPNVSAELIDLKDWPLPFFDETNSPNYNNGVYENPLGRKWADKIGEADAYIIIAPEYNHGYPAVLKNALDWVSAREWGKKPVAFVSYGSALGARSVGQLRQVAIELGLIPARFSVLIPPDVKQTTTDAAFDAKLFAPINDRGNGIIDEVLALAGALKPLRIP